MGDVQVDAQCMDDVETRDWSVNNVARLSAGTNTCRGFDLFTKAFRHPLMCILSRGSMHLISHGAEQRVELKTRQIGCGVTIDLEPTHCLNHPFNGLHS